MLIPSKPWWLTWKFCAVGLYGSSQPDASEFPLEIGLEGVAEIVKSKKFSPGQRVVAMGWGRRTWQTYLTVSEDVLVRTFLFQALQHQGLTLVLNIGWIVL